MKTLYLVYEETTRNHPIMPNSVIIQASYCPILKQIETDLRQCKIFDSDKTPREYLKDLEKIVLDGIGLKPNILDIFESHKLDGVLEYENIKRLIGYLNLTENKKVELRKILL
jgi:hypothetical protein